jgi:CubicO group peptidase (beta-lactamase class C family)
MSSPQINSHQKSWMTSIRKIVLAMAIVMSVFSAGAKPAAADPPAALDDFVRNAMRQYNVPGVALAIVDGDKVFVRGFGVRSIGKPDAVDGDTIFMIASNTKSFTAALVGTFVDQHRLRWDDKVMDYLPEFVLKDGYASRNCTARDLLAHRSGLPAFTGDNLESFGFSRAEIMRRIRFIEPACTFREKAGYSNPGFFAAGMLAAKLGGDSYEHLVEKRLFEPLAMTRSGLSTKSCCPDKNVADAHCPLPDGGSRVVSWDDADPLGPAGEITSTAKDMANWVRMLLNNGALDGKQILTAECVHEMHTPAMVEEPSFAELAPIDFHCGFSYGLGWGVYQYQGHQIIEKGGARTGMRSIVTLVPDRKLGIVVLANQNLTVVPEAVRAYLMDNMVAPAGRDLQTEIAKAHQKISEVFGQKPAPLTSATPSLPIEKYAGEYENELYGTVRVFTDGGKLRWQGGPAKITGSLTPIGYDSFSLAWPAGRISLPETVTFTIGPDGVPLTLATETLGNLKRIKH